MKDIGSSEASAEVLAQAFIDALARGVNRADRNTGDAGRVVLAREAAEALFTACGAVVVAYQSGEKPFPPPLYPSLVSAWGKLASEQHEAAEHGATTCVVTTSDRERQAITEASFVMWKVYLAARMIEDYLALATAAAPVAAPLSPPVPKGPGSIGNTGARVPAQKSRREGLVPPLLDRRRPDLVPFQSHNESRAANPDWKAQRQTAQPTRRSRALEHKGVARVGEQYGSGTCRSSP